MPRKTIETAVTADLSRHTPLASIADIAKGLHGSGVVDYIHISDQLMSWFPRDLWTPENTPMAEAIGDIDSFPDPFLMGAYVASAVPELGISLTTDSLRRGPAEIMQALLTLANMSNRPPILQMGAGEIKQTKPFGHKRTEGLARLEDQMRIFNALWSAADPIDFDGNHIHFKQAWIGNQRGDNKPRFWGLGGGPGFFETAATHADGVGTAVPLVWSSPEKAHESIQSFKQEMERKGRDPDTFTFGGWFVGAFHDDEAVIEAAMQNPLLRWIMAVFGRLNMSEWVEEGFTPPFPENWHYAMKLLPMEWTATRVHEIIDPLPDEQLRRCMLHGSPKKVATDLQAYVDAGVNWVMVYDFLPIYMQPEEAEQSIANSIEVCRLLKAANEG